MVVVSHLFLSLRKSFRGRFDSCESNLPLFGTIYFPTAPLRTMLLLHQERAREPLYPRCIQCPEAVQNKNPDILLKAPG